MSLKTKKAGSDFYVLFVTLLVMWGSYAALCKLSLNSIDAFQLQFYSYGIALCAMLFVLIRYKGFSELRRLTLKQWRLLILCGLFMCAYVYLYNIAMYMADENHITTVIMVNYLFPVFVALFSVPINGERLTIKKSIAILISLSGAFVVVTGGSGVSISVSSLPMYLLALMAAMSWGLFSGFGKKNDVPIGLSNAVYVFVGFAASAALLPFTSSFILPELKLFPVLMWLSLTNFVFTILIWIRLLKISSSSKVAGLSLLSPVASLLFLKLLFSETQINIVHLVGLGLILFGVLFQRERIK